MRHFVALLLIPAAALAQQTSANLTGTVSDVTGAVVADVEIRATNKATNLTRETRSDSGGTYTIPLLPAGDYTVSATKTGFRTNRVEAITLQVGQVARLDLQLQVGEVSESVSVEASGAILQTESATVGTVIDAQKIVDLPLNGRNFVQLAQLIPGVQAGTPGSITVRPQAMIWLRPSASGRLLQRDLGGVLVRDVIPERVAVDRVDAAPSLGPSFVEFSLLLLGDVRLLSSDVYRRWQGCVRR